MKFGSRIDAYLTNVTFPCEKQSDSHITLSDLIVYRVVFEGEQYKFERLCSKVSKFRLFLSYYLFINSHRSIINYEKEIMGLHYKIDIDY
jgi:hypothetical protein